MDEGVECRQEERGQAASVRERESSHAQHDSLLLTNELLLLLPLLSVLLLMPMLMLAMLLFLLLFESDSISRKAARPDTGSPTLRSRS